MVCSALGEILHREPKYRNFHRLAASPHKNSQHIYKDAFDSRRSNLDSVTGVSSSMTTLMVMTIAGHTAHARRPELARTI